MAEPQSWTERQIKPVGGLAAVAIGVVAIFAVAVVAIIVDSAVAATVAGSAAGAIGSIVGAFFGVKIGTDQSKAAAEGEREEAARTKVMAAHLPEEKAGAVLSAAEHAAQEVRNR
jgi:uncharacterized membrane protein